MSEVIAASSTGDGYWREDETAGSLRAREQESHEHLVAFRTSGNCGAWETGDKTDALTTGTDPNSHVIAFDTTQMTSVANRSNPKPGDPCHPLATGAHPPAIAVALRGREGGATAELGDECNGALRAGGGGGDKAHVLADMAVRRLTPVECCRLQAYPDSYFDNVRIKGKPLADGPRYKMLGNSMCVNVVRDIIRKIQRQASQ